MKRLMCLVVVMVGMFASVARAAIPSTERDVLVALYNSTGGAGWTVQTNWNGAPGTECTWYGVTCDSGTSAHVIRIDLRQNSLTGTIPSLSGLTALQSFDVSNVDFSRYSSLNQLSGPIPSLTGLTALQSFNISGNNQLSGPIPSLTGLTALQSFNISGNNQLTGTIPSLTGLTALQSFSVVGAQLTGGIPSLTGLTALQYFNISHNQLSGPIPSLTGLTALQSFNVSNNPLGGTIPSLTGLTALQYFNISSNQLSGTIPSLTGLPALQYFNINDNKLTGMIPSLTGLTALQSFNISYNQLSGPIPSLTGLPALREFFGYYNQLTGITSLTGLPALQLFGASQNQLTGTIPALTGLPALKYFLVDNNQLTGTIPSLTGLTALSSFNVTHNQLTGPIPSLTGLSALRDFDASSNQLTGSIPSLTGVSAGLSFNVSHNQLTGSIPSLTGVSAGLSFNVSYNQLTGSIPSLTGVPLGYFNVAFNQLTGTIPDAPASLVGEFPSASLCPNYLTRSANPQTNTAWDLATRVTPWNKLCTAPPFSPFTISNFGGTSLTTDGSGALTVGYARILASTGSTTPTGVAIFGLRQNGVLITETGVPSVPLISNGRIYAEVGGAVETGLAIANPGSSSAIVAFHFTDAAGADFGSGSTTVGAGAAIGVFLDQTPFNGGAAIQGTFSFSSSAPIGVTALRGFTNERSEFLLTTLPVVDTSVATGTSPLSLSQFADGGGWRTQVILVNPTDNPLTGTIQFLGDGTATVAAPPVTLTANGQAASSFAYTVPRQSSFKLATSGAPSTTSSGSVRVTPTGNTVAPSALLVFSYKPGAVTVSEAGVPAIQGSAFRMYAEVNNVAMPGPIETGVAVANLGSTASTVNFELFKLDGSASGVPSTSLPLPANGHVARFVQELFPALTLPFQGILRISSGAASGISVVGLRGRYNERHDFLITTTPPSNEATPTSSVEQVFPRLVNGGGYTTQFILFSGTAGQASSGNLDYLDAAGLGLSLPVN